MSSTSYQRYEALKRLGHDVELLDPYGILRKINENKFFSYFHYRTGYKFIQVIVNEWLIAELVRVVTSDLVWVNSGELLGIEAIAKLKSLDIPLILYNNDDPTGGRDKGRFTTLLKAVHLYDLCCVVRDVSKIELEKHGAKKVIRISMSYDDVAHQPFVNPNDIQLEFRSDVAFIGTWMRHEKRDEFLLKLIQQNIKVSIWGDRWAKSPYWNQLKPYFRGNSLSGREYVSAIQGAKVCLGLLSKGNRDLHTTRSLEIPYAGGLLCAERTTEHLAFYKEGKEAVFWADVDECARVCRELLTNDELRESIRKAGMRRVREMGAGNETICQRVLDAVKSIVDEPVNS